MESAVCFYTLEVRFIILKLYKDQIIYNPRIKKGCTFLYNDCM